jgi:hypothetical protein
MATSDLKLHSFDLSDFDRVCLSRIRTRLEINSNALVVRMAIRSLAKRLTEPDVATEKPHQQESLSFDHQVEIAALVPAPDPAATLKKSHFVPFSAQPKPIATVTFDSDGITRAIGNRLQLQEEGEIS